LSLLCVTASIPAAAGLGASVAATGCLGAIAAILAGFRSITRLNEIWVGMTRARVGIQAEVARFVAGTRPYNDPATKQSALVENTESIVEGETSGWASLRLTTRRRESEQADTDHHHA
jgi:hypothetical protein